MRSLDLDSLRTFLAVAEAPSFADAGARVHKTQSTVSVQMRRLEDTLGTALFEKKGRRSVLTASGQELLDYAARIVRLNDEAVGRFTSPDMSGRIRIGSPDDYTETFLPAVFGRFARSHPTVEVAIECQTSDVIVDMLEAGEIDVGVVTMNRAYRGAQVVHREQLVWVAAQDIPVERTRPLPLAVWQPGCAWRALALTALDEAGIPYRIAYTGSNGAALTMTVRTGLAVAALPQRFVGGGVRMIGPDEGLPRLGAFDIGLVRGHSGAPELVAAFASHVEAAFAEIAPIPEVAA